MGTYVITEPCIDVKDGSCVEVCPVACIHTVTEASQYFIDPEMCIECEQCVIVCPVDAIYVDTEVPEHWKSYIETNANFFNEMKPPTEAMSSELGAQMVGAARAYAERCEIALAFALVDAAGNVIAELAMDGVDEPAQQDALARAQKTAASGVRSSGSHAVVNRLEVIGAMGASGGTADQNGLAVRAGIALFEDVVESG